MRNFQPPNGGRTTIACPSPSSLHSPSHSPSPPPSSLPLTSPHPSLSPCPPFATTWGPQRPVDLSWDSKSNVLNLSRLFQPTTAQVRLLERGLSFIPRPDTFDKEELRRDFHRYHRCLKIIDYFQEEEFTHVPFTLPSNWELGWEQLSKPIKDLIRADRESTKLLRGPGPCG